jgi:hypothetical protein
VLMYDTRIGADANFSCGDGVHNCRVTYLSEDLGETWVHPTPHPEMPDPSCKGGIVRYEGKAGKALFAINPRHEMLPQDLRVNTTIYASVDNGRRFNASLRVDTSGGYSTIQVTAGGLIAGFYDYSPDGRDASSDGPGGCSFRMAMFDPAVLLQ